MIRKDYIQRYFDELAKVLAAVLQLKQNQEPEKAETHLDEFGLTFLNININDFIENTENKWVEKLITQHHFEMIQFKILEDLLYHKYLLNPLNKPLKNCTLEVLNYVAQHSTDFSIERLNRMNQLKNSSSKGEDLG